jgi:hypothetical protein
MVVLTQTGIFCLRPDCVIRLPSEADNPVKRREFYMSIKLFSGFVLMAAVGLFPTGCGGSGPQVNLALNKPVTASSFEKGTHHNGGLSEVVFNNPVEARYVKMNGLQRGGRYGYSLYEMEVY